MCYFITRNELQYGYLFVTCVSWITYPWRYYWIFVVVFQAKVLKKLYPAHNQLKPEKVFHAPPTTDSESASKETGVIAKNIKPLRGNGKDSISHYRILVNLHNHATFSNSRFFRNAFACLHHLVFHQVYSFQVMGEDLQLWVENFTPYFHLQKDTQVMLSYQWWILSWRIQIKKVIWVSSVLLLLLSCCSLFTSGLLCVKAVAYLVFKSSDKFCPSQGICTSQSSMKGWFTLYISPAHSQISLDLPNMFTYYINLP